METRRHFQDAFAEQVMARLGPTVCARLEELLGRPHVLAQLKSDPGPLGLDTLLTEIGKVTESGVAAPIRRERHEPCQAPSPFAFLALNPGAAKASAAGSDAEQRTRLLSVAMVDTNVTFQSSFWLASVQRS
jgi:hypothetical protein